MAVVLPAVEERGFGAVEVLEEGGGGTLGQFEFGEAGGVAVEDAGVGFEVFGAADDAREVRRGGRGVAVAIEGEEGVGQTAEIDAGALAEFHPLRVGENFRGWRGEEVTPVALVAGSEDGAGVLVRAGGEEAEGGEGE